MAIASTPIAASHSTGGASGRKPTSSATAEDERQADHGLDQAAQDVPGEHRAARAIDMVRNRAMMPSVMSMATAIAVPWAAPAMPITRMPGVT